MKSLRTYIERLESLHPCHFIRVKEPVDWRYGVTAKVEWASSLGGNPSLFLEEIKDYATPVLINLFGHIDRINLALEGASHPPIGRMGFYNEWNRLIAREIPSIPVDDGPVKEVRRSDDEVDLSSIPILKFYEQDAGRYITSGLLVARNPDDPGTVNLSYTRMQLKGRNRLGTSLHSRGNMWSYFERSKTLGEPLDVAVIIGAHPALYLAAAAKITNEYSTAGSLLGEPIELVRAETVDVPVPAQAEIVLEGRILLEEEDEGPFNEYTGYLSGRSTRNVIEVQAITTREKPIYMTIAPSNSDEHLLLSGLPKQARIYEAMRSFMPQPALKDIYWPTAGTHFVCFISLDKSKASIIGLAKQVALLLLGLDPYVKLVAVFSEETNISNLCEALSSIARRCDFNLGSGVEILRSVFHHRLDPSSAEEGVSSKIIFDTTRPKSASASQTQENGVPDLSKKGLIEVSHPCGDDPVVSVVGSELEQMDLIYLLREPLLSQSRLVIRVDEDVDANDIRQVLWALATRFQPAEDVKMIDGKMVLDARKPTSWNALKTTIPK